jgi:hypothetical protein
MYDIIELNGKSLPELQEIAKGLNVPKYEKLIKQDLVYQILDQQALIPAKDEKPGFIPDPNKSRRGRKKKVTTEEPKAKGEETPREERKSPPKFRQKQQITPAIAEPVEQPIEEIKPQEERRPKLVKKIDRKPDIPFEEKRSFDKEQQKDKDNDLILPEIVNGDADDDIIISAEPDPEVVIETAIPAEKSELDTFIPPKDDDFQPPLRDPGFRPRLTKKKEKSSHLSMKALLIQKAYLKSCLMGMVFSGLPITITLTRLMIFMYRNRRSNCSV